MVLAVLANANDLIEFGELEFAKGKVIPHRQTLLIKIETVRTGNGG